jgi:hypothetical protein
MRAKIPSRDQVGWDTPLRLNVAAALAFPDGTMTAHGERREHDTPWRQISPAALAFSEGTVPIGNGAARGR